MKIENEYTLLRSLQSGVNLFVGAGFSAEAKNKDGQGLPTGNTLTKDLINHFHLQEYSNLDLTQLSSILESERKDDFYNFLAERFKVFQYDPIYNCLLKINIKSIITTNIDDLWFKIVSPSDDYYINDITTCGPAYQDQSALDYIPLHGCVTHTPYDFVFTNLNIAASFSTDPDKWHFLTERIQRTPTIFWGYSLSDAGVLQSLSKATINYREHKDKWIILRHEDKAAISYFKSIGFKIIIAETKDFLEYIEKNNIEKESSRKLTCSSKSIFPEYSIPELSDISVRSIEDFYLGAPPEWSDIITGKLHKISHYHSIVDSIYSRKNTVVIGIPVCGKTTLMMQMAYDLNFDGYKLICNSLTVEQAKLIIKKLGGENALIFIDNFSDDIDILNIFYGNNNIRFVVFDRFYFFDLISHKINKESTNIIEISELSNSDIQSIYSKIPESIRGRQLLKPNTLDGVQPSIFELIERNTSTTNLESRFNSLIRDLKNESNELFGLLLMCCYVHICRTPVSYDMVYAFLRDNIKDYRGVYDKIDSLGNLVKELSTQLVDLEDQDYYLPRSTYLSETLIHLAPSNDLKAMILKFYENISSFRICRYYIFRRKAYDAGLMGKAFINWKEGLEFYKRAETRNESPFLKQQCALYLSHKKRFKEAFSWIDKALMQSDYRIPTIRNSHAIILFRANIDKPHDKSGHDSLKKSMDILTECYNFDKRKTYHALVFADHAIQYSSFYINDLSREYLQTAKKWLSEESSKYPWNRNCKRLLRKVNITKG
ncbi:MAG: SIR2 family protein [Deltaproteobacteria bacterium]|nr:SIR2 family protein [Deltaproteobacteria bacterium]